mgnify:CR=1 FL=1
MSIHLLHKDSLDFPPTSQTDATGILAIGGDLSSERLKKAYQQGIFPWYNEDEPIMWWCPDPRFVLFPQDLKVSKSMRKILRDKVFTVVYNQDFESVMRNCGVISRVGQNGTWINEEMIEAYTQLHKEGLALSVEVWQENELVGGLYGIDLGNIFCGESMFSKVSNASKAGFITLVQEKLQNYKLIDCQVYTEHLESLGAIEIDREIFLEFLR